MTSWSVIVLKFGSSVLRGPADLPGVVDEIYRHMRRGKRVLAVVSAFEGHTDRMLAEAFAVFADEAPEATAHYVATGEIQAAAMLTGALLKAGVAARVIDPREAQLAIHGDALNAEPHSIDRDGIFTAFERHSVMVLPGFFGIDRDGRIGLLGRGGSDYSALFLAQRLGAECRLIKDVAGIYDRDPAIARGDAHRLASIGWDSAIHIAGQLVQPKALRFAQLHRLRFAVGALAAGEETQVGEYSAALAVPHGEAPPLRVILLGSGTVGGGVYARLAAQPDRFCIERIVVRDPDKPRGEVPRQLLSTDPWDALHHPADLVIECMGGLTPTAAVLLAALKAGRRVVSANKTLIANRWAAFEKYTRGDTPLLRFSAAVGGALPVLELLLQHPGRVRRLRGIINGTCNYILDAMRKGVEFDAAVAAAQAAGFAEADPTRDVSGTDAAEKLRLMVRIAFDTELTESAIAVHGINAQTSGAKVFLLASAHREGNSIHANVAPQELADRDFLAGAREAQNRIEIELDDGNVFRLDGRGAGRWPTTTSVCGDALEVWREYIAAYFSQALERRATGA
jgi:homoserine dehydrogenase